MVEQITQTIEHLTFWAEGCQCHSSHTARNKKNGELACPLAGRRAPELASGALHALLAELWKENESQFSD